jgi:hypothetical protein
MSTKRGSTCHSILSLAALGKLLAGRPEIGPRRGLIHASHSMQLVATLRRDVGRGRDRDSA